MPKPNDRCAAAVRQSGGGGGGRYGNAKVDTGVAEVFAAAAVSAIYTAVVEDTRA